VVAGRSVARMRKASIVVMAQLLAGCCGGQVARFSGGQEMPSC
jgi:hypothetical protein